MLPCSYHFSVDDVLDSLLKASYRSDELSENEFFEFLMQIHDRFDIDVDLYLFLRQPPGTAPRSLADVSDSLHPFFQRSPWLRFGPHALDDETPPYTQSPEDLDLFCRSAYEQIARFAGDNRTSRWVRLHYFSECYELADNFRSHRVEALLTTDKPAVSYRLPAKQTEQLRLQGFTEFQGIRFVRSHIRIENLVGRCFDDQELECELERMCAGSPCVVVFTHEYELARPEVREMTLRVCAWLQRKELASINDSTAPWHMIPT